MSYSNLIYAEKCVQLSTSCFPEFNYTLEWRKVKHEALRRVLTSHDLFQASSRDEAAGSSSQSQSDSRTAAGASSSGTSESSGTVSRTIMNPIRGILSFSLHLCKEEASKRLYTNAGLCSMTFKHLNPS